MAIAAGGRGALKPKRSLALKVTMLSITVGSVVAVASALAGTGMCSGAGPDSTPPAGPVDTVCYQLVRTLSERVGLMAACATAIIVLTMVGLSRLAVGPERPLPAPGAESPDA
jgi:hypothetical protein